MGSLLPEIPEKLLTEIYSDVAKPGVQQVGKAVGNILSILNITSLPFKLISERGNIWLDNNLEKYRSKMETIEITEVIEVPPEISAPVVHKLAYTTCDELSDMFTELLKNASTNSNIHNVHPNFINIISSISRDEALILTDIKSGKSIPAIYVKQDLKSGSFNTPISNFTHYNSDTRLHFPQNDGIYMVNLVNLGLLYTSNAELSKSTYDKLEQEIDSKLDEIRTPDTKKFTLFRKHFGLTALGKMFIKSSIPDEDQSKTPVANKYSSYSKKK